MWNSKAADFLASCLSPTISQQSLSRCFTRNEVRQFPLHSEDPMLWKRGHPPDQQHFTVLHFLASKRDLPALQWGPEDLFVKALRASISLTPAPEGHHWELKGMTRSYQLNSIGGFSCESSVLALELVAQHPLLQRSPAAGMGIA